MKKFFDKFTSLKGSRFVGVRGYRNSHNEVADVVVNCGINYKTAQKKDFKKLVALQSDETKLSALAVSKKLSYDVMQTAINEMVTSMEKNMSAEKNVHTVNSQAQTDAYIQLTKGVKMHKETLDVYVFGFFHSKNVLEPGVYPVVNSREKTICKNTIEKYLNLSTAKYKNYKVGNFDSIKVEGSELVFI